MTVFVVQEPVRFDADRGQWLPTVNLRNAESFGEVQVLIPGDHVHAAMVTQPTIYRMRRALQGFSKNDYLLPVGDPSLVAMAAGVASKENHGHYKLLRWNRTEKRYDVVEVRV